MTDLLQITPSDLKFRFELRKNIPVTLSLHNPGTERVAFKVKTTSPKKYCVRPSSGFVEPNATRDVQIVMSAQKEYPANMADCKDKFLVQSAKVGPDAKDITADAFDATKGKDVRQIKLRVTLVGPPKPPSPVPEGVEEEASPIKSAFKEDKFLDTVDDLTTITKERNKLKDDVAKAEKEKLGLKKRLELLELQSEGKAVSVPTAGGAQKVVVKGSFNFIHLLLIALVAFFIGHYC